MDGPNNRQKNPDFVSLDAEISEWVSKKISVNTARKTPLKVVEPHIDQSGPDGPPVLTHAELNALETCRNAGAITGTRNNAQVVQAMK